MYLEIKLTSPLGDAFILYTSYSNFNILFFQYRHKARMLSTDSEVVNFVPACYPPAGESSNSTNPGIRFTVSSSELCPGHFSTTVRDIPFIFL